MAFDAEPPGPPAPAGQSLADGHGDRVVAVPRTALATREALVARGLALTAALALDLPPAARALLHAPRPFGWSYLLFAAVLASEIEAATELQRRAFAAKAEATGEQVSREDFAAWYRDRLADPKELFRRLEAAANEGLPRALRPPGVPADASDLAATAREIGGVYREALGWKRRIRGAAVPPSHREVQSLLHEGLDRVVAAIGSVPVDIAYAVRTAADRHAAGLPPQPMTIRVAVELPPGWGERLTPAYAAAQATARRDRR